MSSEPRFYLSATLLLRTVCRAVLVASAALLCVTAVSAAVPTLRGQLVTNISSDNERMISYRFQQHLWRTDDGALHLLVNEGTSEQSPGLSLFRSDDEGDSWTLTRQFDGTDDLSTGDMVLVGDTLFIAYNSAAGDIVVETLSYSGATRAWTLQASELAFTSPSSLGINPAMAIDADGVLWCAYVQRDRSNAMTDIRMAVRDGSGVWQSTGQVFGPTDNQSVERSARPVRTGAGVGMVFKVRNRTYWASRPAGDVFVPWPEQQLFEGVPVRRLADPYASHFGVVADEAGRLHLALAEDFDILYFRSEDFGATWTSPVQLDDERNVVYTQLAVSEGRLILAFGPSGGSTDKRGSVVVSEDGGLTFTTVVDLRPPRRTGNANFKTPRIELPVNAVAPIPILQQVEIAKGQRMMRFVLDLP